MKMNFPHPLRAALIDMDGVLFDSMKLHTLAWQRMVCGQGIPCTRDEFYLYEGMTGAATINLIWQRERGVTLPADEAERLYRIKARYFKEMAPPEVIPGARAVTALLKAAGVRCVLVTGSAQGSLLRRIDEDYEGVFAPFDRVTALDVEHGKPHPEPYLRGLEKAGVAASEAIVIENAPLGVEAAKAAGCFAVAVMTGPIPREAFVKAGADLIFPSMTDFAEALPALLNH